MRTIAFVTQKGGSGKSTLASSLAVAAHEAGERVFVIDMDPQHSLISWAKTRGVDDVPVSSVTPGRLPATLAALEKNGFTLAIIDTAGAEGGASSVAMKAADLNIIPSRPNIFDLWASEQTRATLKALRSDFVFV
jgi:chromosome partitioning protein